VKIKFNNLEHLKFHYIDGSKWRLINPKGARQFSIEVDGKKIVPLNGFITDFASVPFPFNVIFPPLGRGRRRRYGIAALIHDWLYFSGEVNKAEADEIFYQTMKVKRVYL